jgi:iron complex outermembrane receptor protein
MIRKHCNTSAAALLAALSAAALAQTSDQPVAQLAAPGVETTTVPIRELEPVVVTGSKDEGGFGTKSGIPLSQVPQSIQVIDETEFIDRNIQSIGDILKAVPSATPGASRVSTYQAFSVKTRGFLAEQIYNGVRQRYYWNVDPSATSNIERVEVLKGPFAALLGHTFGGGIISIITKRPQDAFSASVGALVGSYDQKLANFDVTGPINKEAGVYYRLNGEIERSGTWVDFTDLDRNNLALSLTWAPSDAVKAYFVSQWHERRTKRGTGLPVVGTVVSNGVAEIPISRYLGDPDHSFKATGPLVQAWADVKLSDAWTLTPRFSYSGFRGIYNELLLRSVQADLVTVNRVGRFDEEYHSYPSGQLDLKGEVKGFGMKHHLLFGTEYAVEKIRFNEQTIPSVPAINALNPVYGPPLTGPFPFTNLHNRKIDSWAIYGQDRIDLTDRWNVILGARASWYDYHRETAPNYTSPVTAFDNEFDHRTYQVGSTYKLGGGWSMFGGYATGYDIQATAAARSFDNTTFEPDKVTSVEVGARYVQGRFIGSASLFQIKRSNVLTSDPEHPGFSIQTGAVRSRGLEIEGTWAAGGGVSVQGGYAYTRGEVTSSNSGNQGFALADTPEHRANLFIRYDLPNLPVQLRGGLNYVGSRPFSDTANVILAPGLLANNVTLPSYTTLDLGATYRFDRTARLDLFVVNVTDKTYFTRDFNDFSVIPGDPRQVILRLTMNF